MPPDREQSFPSGDRISRNGSLLVLCNGHGEDLIALRIIQADASGTIPVPSLRCCLWWAWAACLMLPSRPDG